MQPGQCVYHTSTLKLGKLKTQPYLPDSGMLTLVADIRWDDGTLTTVLSRDLKLDCQTCAEGCHCDSAETGCQHYGCWGGRSGQYQPCHATAVHRAATQASLAALEASRRPVPIVLAWA